MTTIHNSLAGRIGFFDRAASAVKEKTQLDNKALEEKDKKKLGGKYEVSECQGENGNVAKKAMIFGGVDSSIRARFHQATLMRNVEKHDVEYDEMSVATIDSDVNDMAQDDFEDINFELSEPTLTSIPALSIKDAYTDLSKKSDSSLYQLTYVPEFEEDECDVNEDLSRDVHADLDWDMTDDSWDAELKTILTADGAFDVEGKEFESFEEVSTTIDSAKAAHDSFVKALEADDADLDIILSIDKENASVVEKHETELMEKDESKTVSVLKKYEVSSVPVSTALNELLTPPKRKVGDNVSRLIALFEPTQSAPSVA